MNFIQAFIISFFSKLHNNKLDDRRIIPESILLYSSLMESYKLENIYQNELSGIFYGQIILENIISNKTPKIRKLMLKDQGTALNFCMNWFLSFFNYTFKAEEVERIWDGIIIYGFVYLIKTAASIIRIFERVKIGEDANLNMLLSTFPKNVQINFDNFMKMVDGFDISYWEMNEIIRKVPLKDDSLLDMIKTDLNISKK